MKHCMSCGSELKEGATHCFSCGKKNELSETILVQQNDGEIELDLATIQKRMVNSLIDSTIGLFVFTVIVGILAVVLGLTTADEIESGESIISLVAYFGYYIFCEVVWGKTLGKLITKTKVVMANGTKPSLPAIVGRTFCRLIPFDALSFFFGSSPAGWHDKFSKTRVVND